MLKLLDTKVSIEGRPLRVQVFEYDQCFRTGRIVSVEIAIVYLDTNIYLGEILAGIDEWREVLAVCLAELFTQ